MKYVDAGYLIALSVLFVYAVSLMVRRRRLERAVRASGHGATPTGSGSPAEGPEHRGEGGA